VAERRDDSCQIALGCLRQELRLGALDALAIVTPAPRIADQELPILRAGLEQERDRQCRGVRGVEPAEDSRRGDARCGIQISDSRFRGRTLGWCRREEVIAPPRQNVGWDRDEGESSTFRRTRKEGRRTKDEGK
jgi:hypothetical protein